METFDEPRNQSAHAMNNVSPELQQQIAQLAQEKGISLEQARDLLDIRRGTTDQGQPGDDVDPLAEEERNLE